MSIEIVESLELTYRACLLTHEEVKPLMKQLSRLDWVTIEKGAGTFKADDTETGQLLFWAMQKYPGGPWVVRHANEIFESGAE
jgi:hypothetical protein